MVTGYRMPPCLLPQLAVIDDALDLSKGRGWVSLDSWFHERLMYQLLHPHPDQVGTYLPQFASSPGDRSESRAQTPM